MNTTHYERPEWLLDIPATEYHAAAKRGEFLSSHLLSTFRRCPLEYKWEMDGRIVHAPSRSFEIGTAAHKLILEGQLAFDREYIVSDGPTDESGKPLSKATKAYKEWAAALPEDKTLVSTADKAMLDAMRASVWRDRLARELLADEQGFAESTIRTEIAGEPFQARPDWINVPRNALVDFKTVADLDRFYHKSDSGREWGQVIEFSYLSQLSVYQHAIENASGARPDAYLIAVETKAPYRARVFIVGEARLMDLRFGTHAAIEELRECRRTNEWPTRTEEPVTID